MRIELLEDGKPLDRKEYELPTDAIMSVMVADDERSILVCFHWNKHGRPDAKEIDIVARAASIFDISKKTKHVFHGISRSDMKAFSDWFKSEC